MLAWFLRIFPHFILQLRYSSLNGFQLLNVPEERATDFYSYANVMKGRISFRFYFLNHTHINEFAWKQKKEKKETKKSVGRQGVHQERLQVVSKSGNV